MLIAADQETFPIKHLQTTPKIVCLSTYNYRGPGLIGNDDPKLLEQTLLEIFRDHTSIWHNGCSFDLATAAINFPSLIPHICQAIEECRVKDTKIREKLISLAGHGKIRTRWLPNGTGLVLRYDLATLAKNYLKKDRAGQKGTMPTDDEDDPRGDLWRYNYDTLDGVPASQYPKEAAEYAIEDAEDTWKIYHAQEERLARVHKIAGHPYVPEVEALHVGAAFYLYLISSLGLDIDLETVTRLKAQLDQDLSDENLQELIIAEVLRPTQFPRPSNQRDHDPVRCERVLTGKKNAKCSCPRKMTAHKKSSICKAELHRLIEHVCNEHGLPVKRTDPTDSHPDGQVSADAEVMEDIGDLHPVLARYKFKVNLDKMRDVEIPRMSATPVHPHYDELKDTGRTSCSASKLYPSGNVQNVDPRARECYIPTEGWWLLSVDYGGMELVTLAQRILDLFGESELANQLNSGMDAHAYLGAQIALRLDPAWRARIEKLGARTKDDHYRFFCKEKELNPDFYKHWRTFAKPVGLGYPGGMGPDTFVVYAKKNGVKGIDRDMAVLLREIWLETYPRMQDYFALIKNLLRDPDNSRVEENKKKGESYFKQRFYYVTPLGMVRRGCSFTETANGNALQSPGAELAKLGFIKVCRAAFDPTQGSILYNRYRPLAFIHDEILGEAKGWEEDGVGPTEVAQEVDRLMVEGGKIIVPDILLKTEQAYMLRWSKSAKPTFGKDGKMLPWRP